MRAGLLYGPLFLLGLLVASEGAVSTMPEQVHLAYGDDPSTEMYVVWSTMDNTTASTVSYYPEGSPSKVAVAQGVSRRFTNGGRWKRVQYVHRVKVTGLTPDQKYYYKCGSESEAWSDLFSFKPTKAGSQWAARLAVFGDLGNANAQSLPRLQMDTEKGMYDAVLHVGDFAYDMDTHNGRVGDEFMRKIEPVAANIPYMTCPGNHEHQHNFSNYKHRFVMPGDELGEKMFFSFNMGPAHILSFSTEFYFFLYSMTQPIQQYNWLENDLKEATKPENRAQRPWIITMAHRPMYCSNNDHDDCTTNESVIRKGIKAYQFPGLEDLFYKYGVDLTIWAHEHSFERLWPIYDTKVYNGSTAEPYTNPGAPVHIVTGSAGCKERLDPFRKPAPAWSAFRLEDYGYTRMTIYNASHLYMEQVSDDQGGKIVDSVWVKKDHHGPYPPRPDFLGALTGNHRETL